MTSNLQWSRLVLYLVFFAFFSKLEIFPNSGFHRKKTKNSGFLSEFPAKINMSIKIQFIGFDFKPNHYVRSYFYRGLFLWSKPFKSNSKLISALLFPHPVLLGSHPMIVVFFFPFSQNIPDENMFPLIQLHKMCGMHLSHNRLYIRLLFICGNQI